MANENTQHPSSPCTNRCVLDPLTGWCVGCLRTLDEITRWAAMTAAEKQAVLREVEVRRAEAERSDD